MRVLQLGEKPRRGRIDEYGFWFSADLTKWCGGKKSSAERMAEYRRRKRAGEVMKTRNHVKA